LYFALKNVKTRLARRLALPGMGHENGGRRAKLC